MAEAGSGTRHPVARFGRALRSGRVFFATVGLARPRRFVVIREQLRAERASLGRKLLDVPGYTFRVFVTNFALPPEEIWRDYNRRADMENRIAELKHDLAADDFCLREFFATEAAFRSILLLFNLLENFSAPAASPAIASPPRCAPRFSSAALCWPSRPPLGPASVHFLGRPAATHPTAGKRLNLRLPTSPKFNPQTPT